MVSTISRSRSASALLVLMCTALGCADSDQSSASPRRDSAGSAADGGDGAGTSAPRAGASADDPSDDSGSTAPTRPGATGSAGRASAGNAAAGSGGRRGRGGAGGGDDSAGSISTSPAPAAGETGRLIGITAAHNAVRARQAHPVPEPALPPLTYSSDLAATAQAYAEKLANGSCDLVHSMAPDLGENLGWYAGQSPDSTEVVEAWAAEEACYTFGSFMEADQCDMTCTSKMSSNGCGHYTQVVWRDTMQVGCGVAACAQKQQGLSAEIWVCNYKAPGNYIGEKAY